MKMNVNVCLVIGVLICLVCVLFLFLDKYSLILMMGIVFEYFCIWFVFVSYSFRFDQVLVYMQSLINDEKFVDVDVVLNEVMS